MKTSRRDFIRQFGVYLAATSFGCSLGGTTLATWPSDEDSGSNAGDDWPSGGGEPSGSDEAGRLSRDTQPSNLRLQGCTLTGNQAGLFGGNGIRLLRSSGHLGVDRATGIDQGHLRQHIGGF